MARSRAQSILNRVLPDNGKSRKDKRIAELELEVQQLREFVDDILGPIATAMEAPVRQNLARQLTRLIVKHRSVLRLPAEVTRRKVP